jgi:hypothetical protein
VKLKVKTCNVCKQDKPYAAFDKHPGCVGGVVKKCKDCRKQYQNARKDKDNAARRARYAVGATKVRARNARYQALNKDSLSEYYKQYITTNRARFRSYYNAKSAEYRAAKLKQTPPWLSSELKYEMIRIYELCPDGSEVDHIVPIQGDEVRGLHVPWNLQYLSIAENRRKSNRIASQE